MFSCEGVGPRPFRPNLIEDWNEGRSAILLEIRMTYQHVNRTAGGARSQPRTTLSAKFPVMQGNYREFCWLGPVSANSGEKTIRRYWQLEPKFPA